MNILNQNGPTKIQTKYRRPKADEPLYMILDAGNTDVKAMIHLHFGEEIVFPQYVRKLNPTEYKNLASKYKNRTAQFEGSAIFSSTRRDEDKQQYEQGYSVGMHATQVGDGRRLIGAEKYIPDQMGAIFEAAMLQLHPESHDDVHVLVLHPADVTGDTIDILARCIYGRHTISLPDGRKITYRIREVLPYEEPVAGLQDFMLNTKGETYSSSGIKIRPGSEFLVLDIGGGLTGFVPCLITQTGKIEVNLNGAPVIQAGIQDVIPTLEAELKDAFDVLKPIQQLPQNMLHDALMNLKISIKGDDYPCEDSVSNAMQAIATPVDTMFRNRFKQGVGLTGIVITGGGGGVSFAFMKDRVLNHPYVFPAEEDLSKMRFSAIRGGSKGLISFLVAHQIKLSSPALE